MHNSAALRAGAKHTPGPFASDAQRFPASTTCCFGKPGATEAVCACGLADSRQGCPGH